MIVPSNAAKKTAIERFNVDEKKITVNPYGVEKVNKNMFKNIKKDLNFNSNDKIVLCVGRETKAKGVEDFCKVADYFSREKNIKFLFLGGYRDKKYHDYLEEKYENVFFLVWGKIFMIFISSDYFFFYLIESAGQVLAEAMLLVYR